MFALLFFCVLGGTREEPPVPLQVSAKLVPVTLDGTKSAALGPTYRVALTVSGGADALAALEARGQLLLREQWYRDVAGTMMVVDAHLVTLTAAERLAPARAQLAAGERFTIEVIGKHLLTPGDWRLVVVGKQLVLSAGDRPRAAFHIHIGKDTAEVNPVQEAQP